MEDHQDSAKLEFSDVWKKAQCLNVCEVEQLLRSPFLVGESTGSLKPHLDMAYKHSRRFSKLNDSQALQELRMALEDWESPSSTGLNQADAKLAAFEQAQLVNLVPSDVDEAMSLIPSLDRFSPIDLSSALDIIASYMKCLPAVTNVSMGVMERIQSLLNAYSMTSIIEHPRSMSSVISETRVFHESPLDAPKCCRIITEMLYLLGQGQVISEREQNDLFFAFMKLFQSQNTRLRRMVYLLLKDISEGSASVFMVTNCLSKDMQSKNDCYRANAIRLSRILDPGTVAQIDRYLRTAVVDRSPFVASAALVCGLALSQTVPDMIRRWINEVTEAVNSKVPMVQYHAMNLVYEIRKQDKLALQKMVCGFATEPVGNPFGAARSPPTECLIINFARNMIVSDKEPQIQRVLLGYLENCLRNKSDVVTFEASRAIFKLAQVETESSGPRRTNAESAVVFGVDFSHALTILQIGLGSSKPVNRLAALRTLNGLSKSRPLVVARCNQDIEPLLTDHNRNIATLGLTVLLKTAQEANVDRLVKQIGLFLSDLSDMYKMDVVGAIRNLCLLYPAKYRSLLNFLSVVLRDEGSREVKQAICEAIVAIVGSNSNALELGLLHLCEFIEDCEYPNLSCSLLAFIAENITKTSNPGQYVRFIYNRIILECATVRVAAVEALARIAIKLDDDHSELSHNITLLLRTATNDTDDEVRDRVNFYLSILTNSGSANSTTIGSDRDEIESVIFEEVPFSVDALCKSLELHMSDSSTAASEFDILSVPDESTYLADLRIKEAEALASSSNAASTNARLGNALPANASTASESSGAQQGGGYPPQVSSSEFLESIAAVINPEMLGPVQQVCKPQSLTESEAEYTVKVIKHIFVHYTVFEFYITNTLEHVVLANVFVKLSNVDPSVWSEVGSIAAPLIPAGHGRSAYTVLARKAPAPTCNIQASLFFTQREDGDPVGFPDDFPIEAVKVSHNDYLVPRQLPPGQFNRAWTTISANGVELVQKYALNYRTLEATVVGLMETLNLAPCDGTDKVDHGVQKPTLCLAGNSIGNVPVLAQAVLYIHPQRGCVIQLTSRAGTREAAEMVQRALE